MGMAGCLGKQANAFNPTKAMRVLLMLFAALLHATSTVNALACWKGMSKRENVPVGSQIHEATNVGLVLMECPTYTTHCMKMTCKLDTEAIREIAPGAPIIPGTRSTMTFNMCMPPGEEDCEMPEKRLEIITGLDTEKIENYCRVSCCTGYACNGTLGLRSFGTVAAMIAFVSAFFVRWN